MVRLASFTGTLLYVVLLQLPTNAIYSVCWLSAFSVSPVTGRVAAASREGGLSLRSVPQFPAICRLGVRWSPREVAFHALDGHKN